ncbi:MAG: LytTR family DNA-binding domain-containing protein [Planctomycetota bacterium]
MRTLIVDDEPQARRLLRDYCEELSDLEVVGESRDGLEAVEHIRRWSPELLFLDVQMPELDGFGVLQELAPHERPARVVFATAFDQYALRAFEVAALDYLLKPFDRERVHAAVQRAVGPAPPALDAAPPPPEPVLLVRSGSRARAVEPAEVLWIEASGDYAKVHGRDGTFLATSSLGELQERLDHARFLRVHRSAMVYLPAVRQLCPRRQGGWHAVLDDGSRVPVGRTYLAALKRRFV